MKVTISGVIGLTRALEWARLRPLPPDGLPLIGPVLDAPVSLSPLDTG